MSRRSVAYSKWGSQEADLQYSRGTKWYRNDNQIISKIVEYQANLQIQG